jgi:hypothetical protein
VADGGVWKDSGLEMPASLAAHAACGKAAFDSLSMRGQTFLVGFVGVLPPHDGVLFGYMASAAFTVGHALGFKDGFQFTLLPTLNKRGGVFQKFGDDESNLNWNIKFADFAANIADAEVSKEIRDLDGNINLSRSSLDYIVGDEWMARAAATVRLATADDMRAHAQPLATNHVNWLKRQTQSTPMIPSRL